MVLAQVLIPILVLVLVLVPFRSCSGSLFGSVLVPLSSGSGSVLVLVQAHVQDQVRFSFWF